MVQYFVIFWLQHCSEGIFEAVLVYLNTLHTLINPFTLLHVDVAYERHPSLTLKSGHMGHMSLCPFANV